MSMMIHRHKKKENTTSKEEKLPFEPESYTRSEINQMNAADLQSIAIDIGIDDIFNINKAELKKIIIEKLGL